MSVHGAFHVVLVALAISMSGAERCELTPDAMMSFFDTTKDGTCTEKEVKEFLRDGVSPSCTCGEALAKCTEDFVASSGCDGTWPLQHSTQDLVDMAEAKCAGKVATSLSWVPQARAVPSSRPTFPSLMLFATIGGVFGSIMTVFLVRRSDPRQLESLLG
mmetsp:Transcript_58675/g.102713  ORF Transcript_58675/g.102713 Transcript_58675/m.102713 type:complete len:160 (+) Transcript_58675:78-557(+)